MRRNAVAIAAIVLGALGVAVVGLNGCSEPPRRARTLSSTSGGSDAYLASVADTLNDLAANVDLNMLPA